MEEVKLNDYTQELENIIEEIRKKNETEDDPIERSFNTGTMNGLLKAENHILKLYVYGNKQIVK